MLLHIVLLKCTHVQIAFLKITSCDNQALVGCIAIAAVAVHLQLKSKKLVSHLIRCIAITVNFRESTTNLNACLETYWLHHVYILSSTDYFVLSEHFSVAKHVGHSKPGSKPIQLYARLILRLLGQQPYHVS